MAARLTFESFSKRLEWALGKLGERIDPPVDLRALSEAVGVKVNLRPMVPEGVFDLVDGELTIFLQNNFRENPAWSRRIRFTWAHELCHALMFNTSDGAPRPLDDRATGGRLESLCQTGAAYLLMPQRLLYEVHDRGRPVRRLSDILSLCERFDVSPEVVLQRLTQSVELLHYYYAVLLLRPSATGERIEAAAHANWLSPPFVPSPTIGQLYSEWARPLQTDLQVGPDKWEKSFPSGASVVLSNSASGEFGRFVELQYRPAEARDEASPGPEREETADPG